MVARAGRGDAGIMPAQLTIELRGALAACAIRGPAGAAGRSGSGPLDLVHIKSGQLPVAIDNTAVHHGQADIASARAQAQPR